MKVFEPIGADGFQFVQPIAPDDFESTRLRVDAHAAGCKWSPRPLSLIREDEGQTLERGDALWLDWHILVLRPKAVQALKPILDPGDLLLPMKCGDEQVCFLKPKWTIDALDEAASKIWRFSDGTIGDIRRHVFKEEAIGQLPDFYITRIRFSTFYVTDRFVQAWEEAGLRGLRFKLLWDGEAIPST